MTVTVPAFVSADTLAALVRGRLVGWVAEPILDALNELERRAALQPVQEEALRWLQHHYALRTLDGEPGGEAERVVWRALHGRKPDA